MESLSVCAEQDYEDVDDDDDGEQNVIISLQNTVRNSLRNSLSRLENVHYFLQCEVILKQVLLMRIYVLEEKKN